jgi:putative ABC transport system ATP-binding protein
LDLTRSIITEQHLTTLMVTHNMRQALQMGNRLIMLHRGKIILDIQGEEKKALRQEDLIARFYQIQKEEVTTDRMLLG